MMRTFGQSSFRSLGLLSLWLILNTICNFFNRILFHHLGWHFPVLLTLIHGVASMLFYLFVTQGAGLHKFETIQPKFFIYYVIPIATFGCATTILNNLGLDIIDVATVQLVKSTTPIFAAIFAWYAFNKQEPFVVYPLFIITSIGVMVAVSDQLGEKFSSLGLILVLGSAVTRAVASILSEYLMKSTDMSKPNLSPMGLVFYSNPIEIAILFPMFLGMEFNVWDQRNQIASKDISGFTITILIIMDCLLVIALRFVTNLALRNTSAIAVSVFAQVKFVASIIVSVAFFGYTLETHKFIGVLLVMTGTFLYGLLDTSAKSSH
jgi:drug/metabolite transporter (DMT)-like permease